MFDVTVTYYKKNPIVDPCNESSDSLKRLCS